VIQCFDHFAHVLTNPWPRCRAKHQNPNGSGGKVLLVTEVLIRGDPQVVSRTLRCVEEIAILKGGPLKFFRGIDIVWMQMTP